MGFSLGSVSHASCFEGAFQEEIGDTRCSVLAQNLKGTKPIELLLLPKVFLKLFRNDPESQA
jgi:hypothetical protein